MVGDTGDRGGDGSPKSDKNPIWRTTKNTPLSGTERARAVHGLGWLALLAGVLVALVVLPSACLTGVGARDAATWFQTEPQDLNTAGVPQRSRILAADGKVIATFFYENRVDVRLDQVAPIARRAVLAIEDARFYEHGALDSQGTLRALISNLGSGEVREGGSGISQQLVKNLLLTQAENEEEQARAREVSAARKVRELRYAAALERRFSKDEILTRYLNIAYYGGGAYGIEAASRYFFSKPASKLNLPEAALLAGVIRFPYAYDPQSRPGAARERRDVVINRMRALGWIGPKEAADAIGRPLGLRIQKTPNGCVSSVAPFFCDYVQREILTNKVFGATAKDREKLLKRGGLTIQTTLDLQTQKAAQRAVDGHVPPKNLAKKAAAQALVEPGTGQIKGMVVDRKLGSNRVRGKTWINFAADASHGSSIGMQAGSTFKAFTLAAALAEGKPFGTRLMAPRVFVPTGFRNCDGRPVNDPSARLRNSADGEGGKPFTLVTGTHHSVNTFFLALEREVGLCDTVKMAAKLGMRQSNGKALKEVASFTLGANDVSPLRLAAAYAAFGARGKYCEPIAIRSITDSTGRKLKVPSAKCRQVMDKGVADAVNHILRGVLTRGTARGMGIGRPAAGKTGTVDDFSAAWFAGYTPDLASAVWVGDPRGGYRYPMDGGDPPPFHRPIFGATIPAPIWQDTMRDALRGRDASSFHRPPSRFFSRGSGEESERIPDVRGLSIGEAIGRLGEAGFRSRVGAGVPSDEYRRGTVAEMSPGPGEANPGEIITLRPSLGGGGNDDDPPDPPDQIPPFPPVTPGPRPAD